MTPLQEEGSRENVGMEGQKRRRIQRACDACRLKKVRCDGGQISHRACTNCASNKYDCTYLQMNRMTRDKTHIEILQARLIKMESLVKKLYPDVDLAQDLEYLHPPRTSAVYSGQNAPFVNRRTATPSAHRFRHTVDTDNSSSSDDEITTGKTLEDSFGAIALIDPGRPYYYGKSSALVLLQNVMDIKGEYIDAASTSSLPPSQSREVPMKRPEFWNNHPWLYDLPARRQEFSFPAADLMLSLIDAYFINHNVNRPVLHRPTFEAAVFDKLHIRDKDFGSVVLLVCALAARFVDDPRVLLEGSDSPHSAGWKWFWQVQPAFQVINLESTRLYNIQIAYLSAMYLAGTSSAQSAWPVVGYGIRIAQTIGAHRRKFYATGPSIVSEMMKRTFWALMIFERNMSSALGRSCSIQDEDFDLDLPIECDDEYWTNANSALAFTQPVGKPSTVSHFVCCIRITQIHAFALRTIYSISKSKTQLGVGDTEWQERTVADIDSALNQWMDSIPDHLKWDPHMENTTFLTQSALLYADYYTIQIVVHRPFIGSPRKPSPSSFPSLAICTNAARCCIRVLDVQFRRTQASGLGYHIAPISCLFTSAVVLLLNIWGGKSSGSSIDPAKEMQKVHQVMEIIKAMEPRWHAAGRFWDLLNQMVNAADFPLPQAQPTNSKRGRDAQDNLESAVPQQNLNSIASTSALAARWGPSTSGPSTSSEVTPDHLTSDHTRPLFSDAFANLAATKDPKMTILPVHRNELGCLSLHPTLRPDNVASSSSNQQDTWNSLAQIFSWPVLSETHLDQPSYTSTVNGLPDYQFSSFAYNAVPSGAPIDDVTLDMWSSAPTNFGWQDWDAYVNNSSMGLDDNPGELQPL